MGHPLASPSFATSHRQRCWASDAERITPDEFDGCSPSRPTSPRVTDYAFLTGFLRFGFGCEHFVGPTCSTEPGDLFGVASVIHSAFDKMKERSQVVHRHRHRGRGSTHHREAGSRGACRPWVSALAIVALIGFMFVVPDASANAAPAVTTTLSPVNSLASSAGSGTTQTSTDLVNKGDLLVIWVKNRF